MSSSRSAAPIRCLAGTSHSTPRRYSIGATARYSPVKRRKTPAVTTQTSVVMAPIARDRRPSPMSPIVRVSSAPANCEVSHDPHPVEFEPFAERGQRLRHRLLERVHLPRDRRERPEPEPGHQGRQQQAEEGQPDPPRPPRQRPRDQVAAGAEEDGDQHRPEDQRGRGPQVPQQVQPDPDAGDDQDDVECPPAERAVGVVGRDGHRDATLPAAAAVRNGQTPATRRVSRGREVHSARCRRPGSTSCKRPRPCLACS